MSNPAESIPLNYAEELREIRASVDVLVASNLDILRATLADLRAGRTEDAIDFLQTVLAANGDPPKGVVFQ